MGIRQFKPVSAATRFRSVSDNDVITRSTPEKSLTEPLKKSGGRDNHGQQPKEDSQTHSTNRPSHAGIIQKSPKFSPACPFPPPPQPPPSA